MGRIGCKDCISPKCDGCNMLTLERMLNSGKFDCLMDEPHCVNQNAEVGVVKHGRWEKTEDDFYMGLTIFKCSVCREEWVFEEMSDVDGLNYNYCPNCGAKMDGDADND